RSPNSLATLEHRKWWVESDEAENGLFDSSLPGNIDLVAILVAASVHQRFIQPPAGAAAAQLSGRQRNDSRKDCIGEETILRPGIVVRPHAPLRSVPPALEWFCRFGSILSWSRWLSGRTPQLVCTKFSLYEKPDVGRAGAIAGRTSAHAIS